MPFLSTPIDSESKIRWGLLYTKIFSLSLWITFPEKIDFRWFSNFLEIVKFSNLLWSFQFYPFAGRLDDSKKFTEAIEHPADG